MRRVKRGGEDGGRKGAPVGRAASNAARTRQWEGYCVVVWGRYLRGE